MGRVRRCAVGADAGAAAEAEDVLLVLPPALVGLTPHKEALLHQPTQPPRHPSSSSSSILPSSHVNNTHTKVPLFLSLSSTRSNADAKAIQIGALADEESFTRV